MFGLYLGKLVAYNIDHIFVLNVAYNTLILVYYFHLSK